MRPSDVIARLRSECPIFAQRVAGAIGYKQAAESDAFNVPHAFVLLQGITATGEVELSGLNPEMALQMAVMVAVSSAGDDRGQDASDRLLDCFTEVRDALLGWAPSATFGPIMVDGMTLADAEAAFTRARTWAQIDITAAAMVRDIT